MGIVNVTPDSFSDGGRFLDAERGDRARAGAGRRGRGDPRRRRRIDAAGRRAGGRGGGARRVLPVIERLAARAAGAATPQISIDTSKARGRARGARRGRDASSTTSRALRGDPRDGGAGRRERRRLLPDAHARRAAHDAARAALRRRRRRRQGVPARSACASPSAQGIAEERMLLDPGIGFGKTVEHNLELLRRLDELVALGRPLADRHLAQELPRPPRGGRGRAAAASPRLPGRSRRTCSR